jgi:signal transduction histidine kinase
LKLSVGWRSQERLSRAPEAAILGVAVLIVLAVGALSYINTNQTRARILRTRAARDVQKLNAQMLVTVTEAETGERGFLLTGKAEYLKPYQRAVEKTPRIFDQLERRSLTEPDQAARIKSLERLVGEKLKELKETVELGASDSRAAVARVTGGQGEALMDAIRGQCAEINRVAEQRGAELNAESDIAYSRLRDASTLGSILLLGLVFFSAGIISRGFKRREELFEQARATRELLATTLSSIADAVISTDAQSRVTFMNPAAERMTGWREAEAIGESIHNVLTVSGEGPNETQVRTRDGRDIFVDRTAAPILSASGEETGAVLIFRDISEKRRSEIELAESAIALKRSNEELQQFAYSASHDLRSPLNSVNSIAQLLAQRFGAELGDEGKEMIGYITEGLGRLSRLVEDLLGLAVASSMSRDVTQPASVESALHAAIRGLNAEIVKSGATITTCSPLPLVAARDTHVIQVMQNILGNALKYRSPDTPMIQISASRENSEWVVSVKDNGIGFDPKYADQIFQPFKRLHGLEDEGSGIGLSTCRKIVSVYGGRIWAESEPGKGSTFYFSLPEAVESHANCAQV